MHDIIISTAIALIVTAPVAISMFRSWHRASKQNEALEKERGEVADGRVQQIVRAAYLDLKKQGVSGCGPWLSSLLETSAGTWCVGKTNKGQSVVVTEPMSVRADVALTAVRWTIRELAGSRYDLTGLYEAQNKLEGMVA